MADQEQQIQVDPTEGDAGGGAAVVVAKKAAPTKPKRRNLPPFKVLLHNDDVNDFLFVIESITKLTTLPLEEALQKTLEAHEAGVSLLLVTHKERAELYCEQFATFKLTVTMEQDE